MKNRNHLFLIAAVLFVQTLQAQYFTFEKIPAWVKVTDIPEKSAISKYDIMSGYYLTLADYQTNLEQNASFTREVINVVSLSGITSASQITVTFDSAYQKLKIHHLYIWRKGVKTDRTNALSLEIMNNEKELNMGIYMGRITAYDILDDIRKDDLIDFAYTLEGSNPIFDNEKYLFIPLASINQIDLYSYRLLFKNDRNYTYQCKDCDSLVSVSDADGYRQIEIKYENLPAMKFEENMPSWYIPYKYFTLSSFNSWEDVNDWAVRVFSLKAEPELDDVFNEIFKGTETTDEKINKIINYVQDEIRYMGIESGIGSIKPFSPEQVVKKRFGDCKDKSLLLVSLLKKVGVGNAYPALVNTVMKHGVGMQYPSNQIFNHCIVTFDYNNTSYWVDPTIAMQGGDFRDINYTSFGKALIIGVPSDSLSNMPECKTNSGADILEELTISSFTEPADLKITSARSGIEADSRRSLLEYITINTFSDQVTKDLQLFYPDVNKIGEPGISDDIEKNIFTVTYNYKVDGFWQDGDKSSYAPSKGYWLFNYEPVTLYQTLNMFSGTERKFDFELLYPLNLNYRVIIHFPGEMMFLDTFKKYENEAFILEEKLEQLSSKSIQIGYNFRTKTNCISADEYKKVSDQKALMIKRLPVLMYFNK